MTETKEAGGSEIEFLKGYSTTILESALALIRGTHNGLDATRPGLEFRFPGMGRLVGYAVTSVFSTDADDERGRRENKDYWEYVFHAPGPKIAVSLDASKTPGSGSSWGQLNAHIHKALGCRGVITNGGVRDIKEFAPLGVQVLSASLTIGHGNPHFISFGAPIMLQDATFRSGDIVCADQQGAIVIPRKMLPDVPEAAAEARRRVASVARYCESPGFNPVGLVEAVKKTKSAPRSRPAAGK